MRDRNSRYHMLAAAMLATACVSPVDVPPEESAPPVLTEAGPFAISNVVTFAAGAGGEQGTSLPEPRAFVSLPPGTLPGRTEVTIRVWRTGAVVRSPLVEGGLDPVAIPAVPADTLTVTARGPGVDPGSWVMTVPPARPPRLVRTEPPPNKRDVALNLRIVLVFSEPIAPGALSPEAIRLRTGTTLVPATLVFGNAEQTVVWLQAAEPLAPEAEYVLTVGTAVTDLDGEALETPTALSFVTASGPLPAVPYVTVSDAASGYAYLAIKPGRFVGGGPNPWETEGLVTVRNERSGLVVSAQLVGGSMDPVAISALPNDVLALDVRDRSGITERLRVSVPAVASPVVVRTGPQSGMGGVVLNPRLEVVFSEPVTFTPGSLRLFLGEVPVAGSVYAVDPAQTTIAFTASARLVPAADYRLWVGGEVADRQGARLGQDVVVSFATEGQIPFDGLAFVRDGRALLVENGGLVQLTNGSRTVTGRLAWSPDGDRLAFERVTNFLEVNWQWARNLFVLDLTNSGTTQLTTTGGVGPTWSPDGQRIAYSTVTDGSAAIMVTGAGGGDGAVLLNRPGYDSEPAWSPDGQSIIFVSDWRAYDILYDLYAVDVGSGNVRTVYAGEFFPSSDPVANLRLSYDPVWSPIGRKIAFAACTHGYYDCFPSALAVLDVSPTGEALGPRRLLIQGNGIQRPTWSPDGNMLVYEARDCPTCVPYLRWVAADGSAEGLILTNASSPAWRPVPQAP